MAKLWQGSVEDLGLDPSVEAFLSSLAVDTRLLDEDLECSIAHASMLGAQGILPGPDAAALCQTLASMRKEAASGKLSVDPASEDIHSFIESELVRRLGETGKAVHAGRSRNDQVAVAFRLHIVRSFESTLKHVAKAMKSVLTLASAHTDTLMPGYTHLQRAQTVTLAHHLLAWCAALERDCSRLIDGKARANECPLGSGALAGSGLPTDRESTASALGFSRPTRNTMDAVADRDACVDYAAACSTIMTHLSRACEDIALWVSTEYGFMKLKTAASTGSSIMPQKRNPDPAELIRGKTARVYGQLQTLLVMQKGLPYAYNRDLQEDKEAFFDLERTVNGSLGAFSVLVSSLVPDLGKMKAALADGYLEATDAAEYLVAKGYPSRTAYLAAKALVGVAAREGKRIPDLAVSSIKSSHETFASEGFDIDDFMSWIDPEKAVGRRNQTGGPAPQRTCEEISRLLGVIAALPLTRQEA